FLLRPRRPASSTLFPYTTLFRSRLKERRDARGLLGGERLTLVLVAHVLVVLALVGGGTLAGNLSAAAVSGLADVRYPIHHDFLRSEEHTSELQSRENLVCRLLLE